jgi:hypothetical protein
VLQEIERHTRIGIRVLGSFFGTLTKEFENLPLEQGLRRLFRNTNHVFFYTRDRTPGGAGGAAETLTHIWLFPEEGGTGVGQQTHSPLATPAAIEPQASPRSLTQTARKRPESSVMIPPTFDKLRLNSRKTPGGEPVEPRTGGTETRPREMATTSADEQTIATSKLDAGAE